MRARTRVELLCRRRVRGLGFYFVSVVIDQRGWEGNEQIDVIQFGLLQAVINLLRRSPVSHRTGENLGRVEDL